MKCPLRFKEFAAEEHQECIGAECAWWTKCSNDGLTAENDVSAGSVDDNDADTREKLEADVQKFSQVYYTSHLLVYDKVIELLDRQDAITARRYEGSFTGLGLLHDLNEQGISVKYLPSERRFAFDCFGCEWPSLAAQPDQEAYDRIGELQAKVDELTAERNELQALVDEISDAAVVGLKSFGDSLGYSLVDADGEVVS